MSTLYAAAGAKLMAAHRCFVAATSDASVDRGFS